MFRPAQICYIGAMTEDWRRWLWRGTGHLLGPFVRLWLQRRAARGKEDAARLHERFGRATQPRPAGQVIWAHGASVGEAIALLPLLHHLHELRPGLTLLLTTGTVTSAALVQKRGGAGIVHQYLPVDLPGAVDRFLDHWQPDLVLWSESDFWPGILAEIRRRAIPALLVNARMTERSCRRWERLPGTAHWLLAAFGTVYVQTAQDAERLRRLGVAQPVMAGNLKQAAPPLPAEAEAVVAWQMRLSLRPHWLAASTHPGEEEAIARVHADLVRRFPDLLTLIVPRHPQRGPEIAATLAAAGHSLALRSRDEEPSPTTGIFIADTLGELGLWYRLCPLVFMGGSLIPHGGQNPLEPARLGCAVLFGPSMSNFPETAPALLAAGGAQQVSGEAELAAAAGILLAEPPRCEAMGVAGQAYAAGQSQVIETLAAAALARLPA
jgi:3-deoxy-D-manno-octulosonic-acid transferase